MRTQGGGGSKNGQILRTSFMDGPLRVLAVVMNQIVSFRFKAIDEQNI